MEVLEFIFRNAWHSIGTIILISVLGDAIAEIFRK
jgi:hypothetical protein